MSRDTLVKLSFCFWEKDQLRARKERRRDHSSEDPDIDVSLFCVGEAPHSSLDVLNIHSL